jgi:hypothetical protein
MIAVLFGAVIFVSCIYILIPLFGDPCWPFLERGNLSDLHSARKEGVRAISDLDEEYAMGKLTKEDYEQLRDALKHEVAPILKKEIEMTGKDMYATAGPGRNGITGILLREVIRICGLKRS